MEMAPVAEGQSSGQSSGQHQQRPPIPTNNYRYASANASLNGQPSAGGNGTLRRPKVACDWRGCGRSFTRRHDLTRHYNTVHATTAKFWCGINGCNRSESFVGEKKPFARKDGLERHVREVHNNLPFAATAETAPAALDEIGSVAVAAGPRLVAAHDFDFLTAMARPGPSAIDRSGSPTITAESGPTAADHLNLLTTTAAPGLDMPGDFELPNTAAEPGPTSADDDGTVATSAGSGFVPFGSFEFSTTTTGPGLAVPDNFNSLFAELEFANQHWPASPDSE